MSDKWLVTLCCRCCPLRPHCCKIKIWQCFAKSININLFLSVSSNSNIAKYVWVVRKPRKRHHASDICRPIVLLRTTHLFLCCAHFCAYIAHFCREIINHFHYIRYVHNWSLNRKSNMQRIWLPKRICYPLPSPIPDESWCKVACFSLITFLTDKLHSINIK